MGNGVPVWDNAQRREQIERRYGHCRFEMSAFMSRYCDGGIGGRARASLTMASSNVIRLVVRGQVLDSRLFYTMIAQMARRTTPRQDALAPYAARWVAVVNGAVVGVGWTAKEARQAAKRSRPKEEPEVVFVPAVEVLVDDDDA